MGFGGFKDETVTGDAFNFLGFLNLKKQKEERLKEVMLELGRLRGRALYAEFITRESMKKCRIIGVQAASKQRMRGEKGGDSFERLCKVLFVEN